MLCPADELPHSRIEGHVQRQQQGRAPCQPEFDRVHTENLSCRIWTVLKEAHVGNTQVQARMYVTYWRVYENFTHLPGDSIDALFQRFTVVVNNMRDNVDVLPYDDHDRAVKILHSLDRTVWAESSRPLWSRRSMTL
jgi:hypothetical protein